MLKKKHIQNYRADDFAYQSYTILWIINEVKSLCVIIQQQRAFQWNDIF